MPAAEYAEEQKQIKETIHQLEMQRAILGDEVVDASIAALRDKLAALDPLLTSKQRKQVTILFANVLGLTNIARALDAEEVNDMMNALWQRWDAIIVEHGGVIDKHMGDGLMALWGAVEAREDDPERAIRAALAMQSELAAFSDERLKRFGDQANLFMHAGINTGLALLGGVGTTGEYSAIGDAVNLASRLKDAAPTGGVLISHDTYRFVYGLFDVLEQEPIQVKGKTKPLQTYLVRQARTLTFQMLTRGVAGVETRMIGRDVELILLKNLFHDAIEDAQTHIVTIVGDAGIGKSRLLYEFDKWIDLSPERVGYFRGWATPEMQAIPYSVIRRMLTFHFEISESDNVEDMRKKFRTGMAIALNSNQADLVGQLLGLDFSTSQAVQARLGSDSFVELATTHLIDYMRVVASEPTVILLEDIHWADDRSLDLIDHLVTVIPDAPLLTVCLTRPQLYDHRPSWGEGRENHAHIQLNPLSRRASRTLVQEILQKIKEIPPELRELIVDNSEGNPFYVEELIKVLIEDGVIVRGTYNDEPWQVVLERLADVHVPPTLTGILQARLDSLPEGERAVLQRASVVGRVFWGAVVAELVSDQIEARQVDRLLDDLRNRELIFRREHSALNLTDEYIFKHALLQDVIYETVLLRSRRVYHAQIAKWLEDTVGKRINDYLSQISWHYELAEKKEEATEYLLRAGNQARLTYANQEACTFFTHALNLTTDSEKRFQLLLEREEVCSFLGDRTQQKDDLKALQEMVKQSHDNTKRAIVQHRLANWYERRGDYLATSLALQGGLTAARQVGDKRIEAAILHRMASIAWRQGQFAGALEAAQAALEVARAVGDTTHEADSLTTMGVVQRSQGELDAAHLHYQQALDIRRATGDRRGEAINLNQLGNVLSDLGNYTKALEHHRQALEIFRLVGDRRGEAWSLSGQGTIYLHCGEYELARSSYDEALSLRRAVGDRRGEGVALSDLGNVLLRTGQQSAAKMLLEESVAQLREIGAIRDQANALSALAQTLEQTGDLEGAQMAHESALALRSKLGQMAASAENIAGLAQIALKQGEVEKAQIYTEEVLAHIHTYGLTSIEFPFQVYQIVLYVLQASGAKQMAREVLEESHQALWERAERIADPNLRRSFLEQVSEHRELIAMWRAAGEET